MTAVPVPTLAHQGGWDEILMVLVPIAIFAVLLVIANRRASSLEHDANGEAPEDHAPRTGGLPGDGPAGNDR